MSKSTNTNGLNIRFNIGEKVYQLRSSTYDFILEEVKIRKEGKNIGSEYLDLVGNGSTLDHIFQYLYKEHHLRNSALTEVIDLVEELNKLIKSLQETTTNIKAECFISPEDRKSLVSKLQKAEDEIEVLKKENQSLKRKS